MKIPWTAIVGIIAIVWRWFTPGNKWERKREQARKSLKEINDELETVTVKIVDAKKRGDIAATCPLDIRREQLLKEHRQCESEYLYYEGLADQSR